MTPRCSISAVVIRAVKGVIGSKRSASSTAGSASPSGSAAQRLPLLGVQREQADGVGELALAGVDAADEDVEDEVAQLVVVEALALGLGGDEVGDEVRRPGRRGGRR